MVAVAMAALHLFIIIAHQCFKAAVTIFTVKFVNWHSVRLKTNGCMAAITKRFILRCAAAAYPASVIGSRRFPSGIANQVRPFQKQGAIFYSLDFQCAVWKFSIRVEWLHIPGIFEANLIMSTITPGFVL